MPIADLKIDLGSDVPVYRQIVDGVRAAAFEGELQPGHQLPPTRDLARDLGVNRNTVVAAYEALADEGWVRSHTGRGTFLVRRPGASADSAVADSDAWFTAFSRTADGAAAGGLQSILSLFVEPTGGVSFVGSYPAGELIPVDAFSEAMARVLAERGAEALGYGPTAGDPGLRETIAAGMRGQRMPAAADDILVTNGAQQGLEIVFRTFLDRGDAVVIEEPTYTGALSVLGALGARVVGVPLDSQGIRADLLQMALERHRPRLVYLQPTFHNPTTRVMGETRRREVLELAHRFRCPIVEDDWAGDLRLDGEDLPTLHALDSGRHVVYLSTFSKKLMPGLRLGWVSAPPPVMQRLIEMKRVQDCGTSPLMQAALADFLGRGGLDDHLQRIRPAYRRRRDAMLSALERHFPEEARWESPLGGMFVWIRLPEGFDGADLFVAARQEGVLYSRGELFHSDGSGGDTMRLTYSSASHEQIELGVATLGRLIGERRPAGHRPVRHRPAETMPIF
ncbi:MAG TPA: PLP-dependent aminotransferase family protein [Candidatus Polarisedimenticolaceae bacterium]|nr:PLP-dependent aminotransferase family protein [Candidatus Polarisedimenticolaceae bacterium]